MTHNPPSSGPLRPPVRARRLRRRLRRRHARPPEPRARRPRPRRAVQPRPPRRHRRRGQHRRRRRHPPPGPRPLPPRGRSTSTCRRPGTYAVRHRLPARRADTDGTRADAVEKIAADEGLDRPRLARRARRRLDDRRAWRATCMPAFRSCSSPAPTGEAGIDLERRCFVARKRIEHEAPRATGAASTSRRCRPARSSTRGCSPPRSSQRVLPRPRATSGSSRPSPSCTPGSRTNTFPSWPLAHPYRFVAHNGEINTVQGNHNWMRAREALLRPTLIPGPRARLPDLHAGRVRHGRFDEVLELLHLGGRSLPARRADDDPRGVGEPRVDARRQAGLLPVPRLADGAVGRPGVGRLHRRHRHRRRARPQRPAPVRYWVTDDGLVVMASEVGVLDIPASQGRAEGPPAARAACSSSTPRRAASSTTTRSRPTSPPSTPTSEWLARRPRPPRRPAAPALPHAAARLGRHPAAHLRLHDRGAEAPPRADGPDRRRADRLDGHRHADRRAVRAAPAAVRLLPAAVRPGHEPAARRHPRGAGHAPVGDARARGQPARPDAGRRAARSSCRRRSSPTTSWPSSSTSTTTATSPASSRSPSTACTRWPRAATACGARSSEIRAKVSAAIADGRQDHRPLRPPLERRAGADPVAAAHARRCTTTSSARRPAPRSASSSRPARPARCTTWRCCSATAPAAINPYLAFETIADMIRPGCSPASTERKAVRNYIKACGKGVLKVMSKMGISTVASYTGAQVFEADRPRPTTSSTSTSPARRRSSAASGSTCSPRRPPAPPLRPPRPARGARPPRPVAGRRVPVAARGRAPPLQPRDRLQAPARHPHASATTSSRSTRASSTSRRSGWPRCAACSSFDAATAPPVPIDEVEPVSRDRQAVLHRRHVATARSRPRPTRRWPSP